MFENLIYLGIGLVVGVVYHAWFAPRLGLLWARIKAIAEGISIRKDAE